MPEVIEFTEAEKVINEKTDKMGLSQGINRKKPIFHGVFGIES